jgi:type II secretory ATPase GspE/PulE/Tfp pilus assembly ATPase PilB-like protein
MSAFIGYFQADLLAITTSSVSLPFHPGRLLGLLIWVYVCLYFVVRTHFSPLVPVRHRALLNVLALLTGPVPLFVLLTADILQKSAQTRQSVMQLVKERLGAIQISRPGSRRQSAIKLLDSSGRSITDIYGHGKGKREDRHILDITERIVASALDERASDILIDPIDEATYTVRFRVDGVIREVERIEVQQCQAVINSIKAVSGMDIAERRRPQDGAFIAKRSKGTTASFRVASAGAVHGEKVSVRVLSQDASRFTLESIGLSEKQRAIVEQIVARPSGMILMCGPTGSGKTTTLYAMLNQIDLFTRNVITVEDPIEYVLPNASQIEVNPKADITFAKCLRSILRQDPDVICVGEIRDEETAEIALRASQTGHLVLATVHTTSNAAAMVRLLDLGITPLLLSSGLDVLISQRLLRRLCSECKAPAQLTQHQMIEFRKLNINYANIFQAVGCERCNGTGYYDRTAIFDILTLDNKIKAGIANNPAFIAEIKKEGDKKGKSNLWKQGMRKVVSGLTSLEELKRVVG